MPGSHGAVLSVAVPRVAAIGECMVELSAAGPGRLTQTYGGDSLNTAVYLARLGGAGIAVDYVTALGDDLFSDEMVAGWRAEGVGTGLVARLAGRLPGLYVIRADPAGERAFQYWRTAAAARAMFQTPLTARVLQALPAYDLIYLTGNSLAILSPEDRGRLVDLLGAARARGGRVAFDSNYRPANWEGAEAARTWMGRAAAHANIALPTFDDETALHGDANAGATAARLVASGIEEVVVKDGSGPCALVWPGGDAVVAARKVALPTNTAAAGDAFNAGYLAARLARCPPPDAAEAGHRLAATVIQHPGAIIPKAAMPAG
jgi:2-dehydro-3-deoxygluconokinase